MTRIGGRMADFVEAENAFREAHKDLEEALAELDRDLQAHLDEWAGDAAGAYWKAHAEWKAAANEMPEQIARLHHVLTTAHGNFHNAVTRTLAMWATE